MAIQHLETILVGAAIGSCLWCVLYMFWMNYTETRDFKEREANRHRRAANMTRAKDEYVASFNKGEDDG